MKDKLPQGRWKLGKIIELIKGKDQAIRAAKLLVSPDIVLQRALNMLHPIECPEDQTIATQEDHVDTTDQEGSMVTDNNAESDLDDGDHDNGKSGSQSDDLSEGRPMRKATLAARQKLRSWLNPKENFAALGSVAITIANAHIVT